MTRPPISRLREKFDDRQYPMDNIKEGETLRYCFPYGNLKTPFLREKTASWIVEQTFLKILDEEKVKSFMREKCIYKDAHNIIVYK